MVQRCHLESCLFFPAGGSVPGLWLQTRVLFGGRSPIRMTHARSELIKTVKLAGNATWVTLRELESSRSIIDADRCRCLVKKASMNLQHTCWQCECWHFIPIGPKQSTSPSIYCIRSLSFLTFSIVEAKPYLEYWLSTDSTSMENRGLAFRKPDKKLLAILEQDSSELEQLRENFASICRDMPLVCFFEELDTHVSKAKLRVNTYKP